MDSIAAWLDSFSLSSQGPSGSSSEPDGLVALLPTGLFSSRTALRVSFLNSVLKPWASDPANLSDTAQLQAVAAALVSTAPLYVDRASRKAALAVLETMVSHTNNSQVKPVSASVLQVFSQHLEPYSSPSAIYSCSPATRFSLLCWFICLFRGCITSSHQHSLSPWFIQRWALLYDSLCDESSSNPMRKSALTQSSYALLSAGVPINDLIDPLISSSIDKSQPWQYCSLLGLVIQHADQTAVREHLDRILSFFSDKVLRSREIVPHRAITSLSPFFNEVLPSTDVLVPSFEAYLSISSQAALSAVAAFCRVCTRDSTPLLSKKMCTTISDLSRSANSSTRKESADAYIALLKRARDPTIVIEVITDILTPLSQGKTASADHRMTLSYMLSQSSPDLSTSQNIIKSIIPAACKEINEAAAIELFHAAAVHTPILLINNVPLPSPSQTSLTKAMQDMKPLIRRLSCDCVGSILLSIKDQNASKNDAITNLLTAILPALDNSLKNSNTVLTSTAGPVDSYTSLVLISSVLPFFSILAPEKLKNAEPILKSIDSLSPKPSFLIWSKVYRKFNTPLDQKWLVMAVSTVLQSSIYSIDKDSAKRSGFSSMLLYLYLETSREIEPLIDSWLTPLFKMHPQLFHSIIFDQLGQLISNDENTVSLGMFKRLRKLLVVLSQFNESVMEEEKQTLLINLLTVAHHPSIDRGPQPLWIEMLRFAGLEPSSIVTNAESTLLDTIWVDAEQYHGKGSMAQAPYRALSTIILVSPEFIIPKVMQKLRVLLENDCDQVSQEDCEIFSTPEGTLHTDVLYEASTPVRTPAKKKGADLEKWDEELRASLAKKKTGNVPISKSDQALVDAQLAKESSIRTHVKALHATLNRCLHIALSLARSPAPEKMDYRSEIIQIFLSVAKLQITSIDREEYYRLCKDLVKSYTLSLEEFNDIVIACVLRTLNSPLLPNEFRLEPFPDMATRILHQLRLQSEQNPFQSAEFTLIIPVLESILGGPVEDSKPAIAAHPEHVALVVDLLSFHARQASLPDFPRLAVIDDLLRVLSNYPTHSKSAALALADLGKYAEDTATNFEITSIIHGILCDEAHTRFACLQCLQPLDLTEIDFPPPLYLACHDHDPRNESLATDIWDENALSVPKTLYSSISPLFEHHAEYVRESASLALVSGLKEHLDERSHVLQNLIESYLEKSKELVPQEDEYGMIVTATVDQEDPWRCRVAQADTLRLMAPVLESNSVDPVFKLLIDKAALSDRSSEVRSKFIQVGIAYVEAHGEAQLNNLSDQFEKRLAMPSSGESDDRIFEGVVIFYGRLARHLQVSDPRTSSIMKRLLEALKIPSELVQLAVSDCLGPLVPRGDPNNRKLADELMISLFTADTFGERRGAAYGLLGFIRGHGISALKEFSIIQHLEEANEDKKNPNARQGFLFGVEIFYAGLGKIFEPFIIKLLPYLLSSLGDNVTEVRNGAQKAVRVMMQRLSEHAVKMVLPILLTGLDDTQWRAKKGAVEMLGAMSHLSPNQLSFSLPQIIPRLTQVLTDTHVQVRNAANASLKQFGEVIGNPEIREMQNELLAALVDPAKNTLKALDVLLTTVFAHYLDNSSLALIVPIVERALRERMSEYKRKASQIVGNMASLTGPQDLKPYLPQVLPYVREVLVDPVPESRATAARSLGSLVERLGEEVFPDLIPSLISKLESDKSGVDQQGAAQGLAEILSALGVERLESFLPTVLTNTASPKSYIREGFISLLVYLPTTFGERFQPYLAQIVQPILSGLADSSDFVRDASMRAGRMMIVTHSDKAVDLLLPELENSLFHEMWRIRSSSIQLIGELLFRISGITGKVEVEEEAGGGDGDGGDEAADETPGAESSRKALLDALGQERRDQVLSKIFIVRQDASSTVRNHGIHVWKVLVQNTPRTTRDLVPTLMAVLVDLLSSDNEEIRDEAARTLGELCKKLGERVLDRIFTVLDQSLSGGVKVRQGVCLAMSEVLASTSKQNLQARQALVVGQVRRTLVDEDATVRAAAARTFDSCLQFIGVETLEETTIALLQELEKGGIREEASAGALREIMHVRAQEVFPIIAPSLIAPPISITHAQVLMTLLPGAKGAITPQLTKVLSALHEGSNNEKDEQVKEVILNALKTLLSSVTVSDGLHHLMMHLLSESKSREPKVRSGTCEILEIFCQVTSEDFSEFYIDWARQLVSLYEDREESVRVAAVAAMEALGKKFSKHDMEIVSVPLRRTIENTGNPGVDLAGFSQPNGLKPIFPILLQGILGGTAEQREQSAYGIADIVSKTPPEVFKPFVPTVTGPLIRILGERLPPPVKAALLHGLTALLERLPQFLRPFFPQLQRTFIKNVSDPTSLLVRNRAMQGLAVLMASQPRVDPVVTELITSSKTEESGHVRESLISCLAKIIESGGKNVTQPIRTSIVEFLQESIIGSPNVESLYESLAEVFSALSLHELDLLLPLLNTSILASKVPKPLCAIIFIRVTLENNPGFFKKSQMLAQLDKQITAFSTSDDNTTARISRKARELFKAQTS